MTLFDAVHERFKTDDRLRKIGRRLYEGTGQDQRAPYVSLETTSTETLDTFDTDILVWSVQFEIVAGSSPSSNAVHNIADALRHRFDDAALDFSEWDEVGCQYVTESGPNQDEAKQWRMTIDYQITASRVTMVPAVRNN